MNFVIDGESRAMPVSKPDIVGDCALDFLSRQKAENPFYLLVPFYAPHTPYDYQPEEYRKWFEGSKFSCFPANANESLAESRLGRHAHDVKSMHAYSALIAAWSHVGRIVKRLEAMGVRDNTLVIFTADQGWNAGHHGVWGKGNGTGPLHMYEESLRVPMIWNHPARSAPVRRSAR